ncbi:hypothetical protein GC207_00095 [bacterium]|nr:hypothetical protein [bacterium]
MKAILSVSVLALILVINPNLCFGSMDIAPVSRARAKELGMQIRTKSNGPKEIWVELEFKPIGVLKDFDHVSLEIREGDELLLGYAPLKEKRSKTGSVSVGFLAARSYLDKLTLSIVVGRPMDFAAYEIRVKDFVEQERIR